MPPLIDDSSSASADKAHHLSVRNSDVKSEAEDKDMWIVTKVSIAIDLVELGLHYGLTRDASLATMQVLETPLFKLCLLLLRPFQIVLSSFLLFQFVKFFTSGNDRTMFSDVSWFNRCH